MKNNHYVWVAAVAAACALSACTTAPTASEQQGSSLLQGLGPGGLQGNAPYGADPEAYFRPSPAVAQN